MSVTELQYSPQSHSVGVKIAWVMGAHVKTLLHIILEPAPQGMGAPQATGDTQGNDADAHRCLPVCSCSPPRVHLMAATMVYVAYYTT